MSRRSQKKRKKRDPVHTEARRKRVPVSAEARLACRNALKHFGLPDGPSARLTDQLIEIVQSCAYSNCERPPWPPDGKVRSELENALEKFRETHDAVLNLSGPALFLTQNAVGADYNSLMGAMAALECGVEEAINQTSEVITGKTGAIHLMLRSAAVRWRNETGEWPARTNSTTDGVATTPFLAIMRDLLKDATPDGQEVPKISDYMFRKALDDAGKLFAEREERG